MDRLLIDLGGHPFTGDDLEWAYLQHAQVFTEMCKTLNEPFVVISGCVVSIVGANTNWTAGLVYINGEVCLVSAGSVLTATNDTWDIVQTYDPLGNDTYEDSNNVDTYIYRRAKIQGQAGGVNLQGNQKYLGQYLTPPTGPWISFGTLPTGTGSWTVINGIGSVIGYRKNRGNVMEFNGDTSIASYNVANDSVIATIPYPPSKDLIFICPCVKNGTLGFIQVKINTAGDIMPLGLAATNSCTIWLESIRYTLEWTGIF